MGHVEVSIFFHVIFSFRAPGHGAAGHTWVAFGQSGACTSQNVLCLLPKQLLQLCRIFITKSAVPVLIQLS